jgi:hypothetical protein
MVYTIKKWYIPWGNLPYVEALRLVKFESLIRMLC